MSTPLKREMFPMNHGGTRAYNGLMRSDYRTVESVISATDAELRDCHDIGATCLTVIRVALGGTSEATYAAYKLVIADLSRRSEAALKSGDPREQRRKYIQSVELARQILIREADLGEEVL